MKPDMSSNSAPSDEAPPQNGWNASALDQASLQRRLGYNVRQVEIFMNGLFEPTFERYAIRPVDYCILALLESNRNVTQTAIAETLHVQRTNLVRSMARLESQELLKRVTDKSDKRNQFLLLTEAGRQRLKAIDAELEEREMRWMADFSEGEVQLLKALLKRLYDR